MKKRYQRLSWHILLILVLTILAGSWQERGLAEDGPFGSNQISSTPPEGMSEILQGTVVEVIDAGRHFYVRIDTGDELIWVSVPAFSGKAGEKVLVPPGVMIIDFKSIKLNRTFKMMIFVGSIRRIEDDKVE